MVRLLLPLYSKTGLCSYYNILFAVTRYYSFYILTWLLSIGNRQMYDEWTVELKAMADRIISMRQQLFDAMQARGIWSSDLFFLLTHAVSVQLV